VEAFGIKLTDGGDYRAEYWEPVRRYIRDGKLFGENSAVKLGL
jgi:hypothetical protein